MKPDFLCIGAQKAATTWLCFQMAKHPDIWVPPVKELNYYNNPSNNLIKRLFSKHWLNHNWRVLFKQNIWQHIASGRIHRLRPMGWHFKYFFMPRNLKWYTSLFPNHPGKISGEFSVAYAALPENKIAQISSNHPDVKIIFLLRDPIQRLWSQLKMNLGKYRQKDLSKIKEEEINSYFKNPYAVRHSEYIKTLEILEKYFPPEQLFIGFFGEVSDKPQKLLKKVFQFLKVDFPEEIYREEKLRKKANVGLKKEIPVKYRKHLAKIYLPQIEQLHEKFNNKYTKKWLDDAQKALKA